MVYLSINTFGSKTWEKIKCRWFSFLPQEGVTKESFAPAFTEFIVGRMHSLAQILFRFYVCTYAVYPSLLLLARLFTSRNFLDVQIYTVDLFDFVKTRIFTIVRLGAYFFGSICRFNECRQSLGVPLDIFQDFRRESKSIRLAIQWTAP